VISRFYVSSSGNTFWSIFSSVGDSSVFWVRSIISMLLSTGRLAYRARHARLRRCYFDFSEMYRPVSEVTVGPFRNAAIRSRFLRPALCLLRQTI